MTDTPSALELYDDPQTTWVGSDSEGNTVRLKLEVLADAALDELTRKLKQAETTINQWEVKAADLMRERNEAEAKVAKLENQNAYYAVQFEFDPRNDTRLVDAVKRVEQAEAERDELWKELAGAGAERGALKAQRDRWHYLAEKATWCFHEGMHLLHYNNPNTGSWFPAQVVERWNQRHRDKRLSRWTPRKADHA